MLKPPLLSLLSRWAAVAATALAALVFADCAHRQALEKPAARELELPQAIAEINAAPVPEGVDPALFRQLQDALIEALEARGVTRVASAPPAGAAGAVSDLSIVGSEALGYSLEWTYVSLGDYSRDGEVNISDLTPLGRFFDQGRGGENWGEARQADGNGDGLVNLSDITTIGQHFMVQVAGYEVFQSGDPADYPASPDAPNGPGTSSLGTVPVSAGVEDSDGRLRFSFTLPDTEHVYWVRPYMGTDSGAASNQLNLMLQLKPGTVVLDSATQAQLAGFTGNVLTFTASTSQLAALAPGNIIVSPPLTAAPEGLLGRVESVSGSGPVTVGISAADLTDALASAEFTAYIPLRPSDVKSSSSSQGVVWRRDKTASDELGLPFFLDINDMLVDDADNNPGTTDDQVHASGNVMLTPALVMNFKVDTGGLEQLDFGGKVHVLGGLTFDGDVAADWDKEFSLHTWNLMPIIITIAGFPFVINPSIEVVLGTDGNCMLDFVTSMAADAYIEGTVGYKNGSWGTHIDYAKDFSAPDPIVEGQLFNKSYAGARLNLKLYNLFTVGSATLLAGTEVNADVTASPWWSIAACIEADADIGLFGLGYSGQIFHKCWPLKDAGGPYAPPVGVSNYAATLDHAETADYDIFRAVLPLSGGRVVAAGDSFLFPILVMFDASGNVVWQNEYSEPGDIQDLAPAPDGGIIAVGSHIGKGLVMKVAQTGALIWAREVAGPKSSDLYSVESRTDGGYVAVGEYITDEASSECWEVLFSDDGTITGSTTYGTPQGDRYYSISRNPDGSFFAAGEYANNSDAWLSQLNADGSAAWHRHVYISGIQPGQFGEWATGVAADGQGGCYLTGLTNRGALSFWLIRYRPAGGGWVRIVTDNDFALTWEVSDIAGLRDGGVAIAGQTGTAGPMGGRDGYVVLFSEGGGLVWASAYGGHLDDGLFAIGEKIGGAGLFTAGSAMSFRTDNEQDAWSLLVRPGGTVAFTQGSGAGRYFMSGDVIEDEDLTEHYVGFSPTVVPLSPTMTVLTGTLSDYGSTPVHL